MSCSRTKRSDAGEARTRGTSVSNHALMMMMMMMMMMIFDDDDYD